MPSSFTPTSDDRFARSEQIFATEGTAAASTAETLGIELAHTFNLDYLSNGALGIQSISSPPVVAPKKGFRAVRNPRSQCAL